MSKIDEAYIKYVLNQGDDNPDYAIVFKILDELKPYVELAELHIKLAELYLIGTKMNWFEWTDEMNELYSRQKELVKQIKEQQ